MQENDSADDRSSPDAISTCGNGRALASLLLTFAGATLVVPLVVSFVASPAPASAAPIAAALSVVLVVLGASAAASQFAERLAGRPVSSVARAFAAAPRIVLGSVLLALLLSGAGAVFALVAADMISTPFTVMLLTEVLLDPLIDMVVVIVDARRRFVKTPFPGLAPKPLLHSL